MLREAGIRHVHVHFAGSAARTAFWLKRLFGVEYSVTAHANDIFRDDPRERLDSDLPLGDRGDHRQRVQPSPICATNFPPSARNFIGYLMASRQIAFR